MKGVAKLPFVSPFLHLLLQSGVRIPSQNFLQKVKYWLIKVISFVVAGH